MGATPPERVLAEGARLQGERVFLRGGLGLVKVEAGTEPPSAVLTITSDIQHAVGDTPAPQRASTWTGPRPLGDLLSHRGLCSTDLPVG